MVWCAGWEGGFLVSSVDLGSQGFYLWAGEVSAQCLGGDLTGHFLAVQETPFCHPPLRPGQVTQSICQVTFSSRTPCPTKKCVCICLSYIFKRYNFLLLKSILKQGHQEGLLPRGTLEL